MFKQYDKEEGKTWHIIFSSSENPEKKQETSPVERELTEDFAKLVAEKNGYDTFEIIETVTTIKRYNKE